MLLLAISFKKQCCDKVLVIVVRVLFTKTKKNSKKQLGNRYQQVLAMEHISYNKTFDSLSGFKETFENEDCAYVISA